MRVTLTDDAISINPSQVIVLTDDQCADTRLRSALMLVMGPGVRKRGIEVRSGMLGHPGLAGVPVRPSADEAPRGRFLAPLVESGLLAEGEGATLLLLTRGPIYDWDDWAEELLGTFAAVHVIRFAAMDRVHDGAIEHRVERLDEPGIEALIEDVLAADRVTELAIEVESGALLGMPAALSATAMLSAGRVAGVRYAGALSECSLFAPITPVSLERGSEVSVTASYDGRSAGVRLRSAEPTTVHPLALGSADTELLVEALAAYGSGSDTHHCPKCGREHAFTHALLCEHSTRVFVQEATRVLAAWRSAGTTRLALLPGPSWSAAGLPESSAVWFAGLLLLRTADGTHAGLAPDGDTWCTRRLEQVHPGLERDPATGVLVLSGAAGPAA